MNMKKVILFISLNSLLCYGKSQSVSAVWKLEQLMERIADPDTLYVLNFWAVWCKPCVEELPSFDTLSINYAAKPVKVLLVNLDFKEDLQKKVNPFLKRKGTKCECVLLDETDGNRFINGISSQWSGAIPGTLFKKGDQRIFVERKLNYSELDKRTRELLK
jgi:thiol-disulfide isomerase/thioredoxin